MTMLAMGFASALHAAEPMHDHGLTMQGHMMDDPVQAFLRADRLEWQTDGDRDGAAWEFTSWIGRDANRLWVRAEGDRAGGKTESSEVEALWGHPVARWWDVVAGIRQDFAPGPSRSWAALGLVGMAPYEFDVRLTGYVSAHGATALKMEIDYDLLLTQRWILQPRAEATWFGKSDSERDQQSGVAKSGLGLRLRYELRREFAPYVGVEWERPDNTRGALNFIAGLRAWL